MADPLLDPKPPEPKAPAPKPGPTLDLGAVDRSDVLALTTDQLTIADVTEYALEAHGLIRSYPETLFPELRSAVSDLDVEKTAWLAQQMLVTYEDAAERRRNVDLLALRVQANGLPDMYSQMWVTVGRVHKAFARLQQDLQIWLSVQVYRGEVVRGGDQVTYYGSPKDLVGICRKSAGLLVLAMETAVEAEELLRSGNPVVWNHVGELIGRWRHNPDGFFWIMHVLKARGFAYITPILSDKEGISIEARLQGFKDEVPQTAAQLSDLVWQAAKKMQEPSPDFPAIERMLERAQQRMNVVADRRTHYRHFGGHFSLTQSSMLMSEAESSLYMFYLSARRRQKLYGLADRYARGVDLGRPVFEVTGGERDYGSSMFTTVDAWRSATWKVPLAAATIAALIVFAPEIAVAGKEAAAALMTWAMANPEKAMVVAEFLFATGMQVAEMGPQRFFEQISTPEGALQLAADLFILHHSMGGGGGGGRARRTPAPDIDIPAPPIAPQKQPRTTRGSRLAQQQGLPEAETGYHWATTPQGELVYRRNPGTSSGQPQRRYNPETKSFENAPTKFAEMRFEDLGTTRPCFIAGTLVATEVGMRPIETIAVGDRVWAWDAERLIARLCDVVMVHRGSTERLVELDDGNHRVVATWGHRLAIGNGWIRAGELTMARLVSLDGTQPRVTARPRRVALVATFNLEIAELHNFHVGERGLRAHNGFEDSGFNNTERRMTVIYVVRDRTQGGKIIYVGKTFQGEQIRFGQHRNDKPSWKSKAAANQLRIDVVDSGNWTAFDTAVIEEHHIRKARAAGHPLENDPKSPPIGQAKFDHFKKLQTTC